MEFIPYHSSSAGNLYACTSGGEILMIECGVPIKRIRECLKFRLCDVQGCLVSHLHLDHAKSIVDLNRHGIDCYMSKATAEIVGATGHRVQIVTPGIQFAVGRFRVKAFETEHDCFGSLGFLVSDGSEKLLFATDTYYLRNQFVGVNIIAIECNYSQRTMAQDLEQAVRRRLLRSHFSLEHVIEFLQATDLSRCREIHLLHLSDGNSDVELFRREVMRATGKPVFVAEK